MAALSAIKGYLTDEFEDDMYLDDIENTPFVKNKNFFIDEYDPQNEVYMGPNIKPVPRGDKLPDTFTGKVCLKVGDNISTDHIVPVTNKTNNQTITVKLKLSPREKTMIQYGGLLNAIKELGGDF